MSVERTWLTRRKIVLMSIGIGLSAVFVYATLRGLEVSELRAAIERASWPWLALTLITKGLAFVLMTWRSKRFLKNVADVPTWRLMRAQLFGFTGNSLLPFRLGEVLKLEYISRHAAAERTTILAVLAAERLLDTWMLLLIFVFTAFALSSEVVVAGSIWLGVALTIVGTLGALIVGRYPERMGTVVSWFLRPAPSSVQHAIMSRYESFSWGLSSFTSMRELFMVVMITVLYWCTAMFNVWLWCMAFSLDLPWWSPMLVLSLIAFGTALPSAPGFVGTYHYFCTYAFKLLGVTQVLATSIAIVGHFMSTIPYTLIGIVVFAIDALRDDLHPPRDEGNEDTKPTASHP